MKTATPSHSGQRSADNPGWRGSGVPARRELLVRRWIRAGRLVVKVAWLQLAISR